MKECVSDCKQIDFSIYPLHLNSTTLVKDNTLLQEHKLKALVCLEKRTECWLFAEYQIR
jgi:hypothetical protein